ncbi:hypothetical protein [Maribellus sediminis]|uniref:hypothetical protein n=1 Tax=Maribellus sediminis TaxID=2696285 RepID=UPI00142FE8DF|nr:hypothetical protein [Maribellus sediminis]
MQTRLCLTIVSCFVLFITFTGANAQDYLPYSAGKTDKSSGTSANFRNIEATIGYLPQKNQEGIKTSIGISNILFKRVGFYTSFEFQTDDSSFTNIVGGQISIHKLFYLWGGMDLFTDKGLIQSGFEGSRKEAGIGITPYKFLVFRFGYSNSVGPSLAAGVRFPL